MENFNINKNQLKIFFSSFIAMFIIVMMQTTGIRPLWKFPKLDLRPNKVNVQQDIRKTETMEPKIRTKPDTFRLKENGGFPHQTFAETSLSADNANGYIVADYDTGEIIAEKNSTERLPIASLTKVMTAVTALDLSSPSELITINNDMDTVPPTRLDMVPGQKMTLEELLNGTLLTSANDAALQIKDGINEKYHQDIFIDAMNEKAKFIGLNDSHFSNPQGFDSDENYSSPEDLVRLTHYALTNYPLIREIVKKDYQFIPANENHKQYDLNNWNGLLGVYPGTEGVKIGNTGAAKYTTIVLAQREGKRIIVVLLGAPGVLERDMWAAELLDTGFQRSLGLPPVNITQEQLNEKYSTWQYWQ